MAQHWTLTVDATFSKNFFEFREFIFRDRPGGLSRAMKELLVVALNIAANNPHGALVHIKDARRAGLKRAQLCDAVMVVCLVLGVSGVHHGADEILRVWDAAGNTD